MSNSKVDKPIRQPITSTYYRRNADFNPEFLDKEALLKKYDPLIRSIHKYFCSYAGILDQQSDVIDLLSQIHLEFLNLAQKYDPKRGVDFPGYIKLNLRHRIYYYVTKLQKQQTHECLFRQYGEDATTDDLVYDKPDESAENAFIRIEAINSIPWEYLSETQCMIVKEVLQNHRPLEQIARIHGISIKNLKEQFEDLCELLIKLNTSQDVNKEENDYDDWDEEEWFGTEIEDWGYGVANRSIEDKRH